MLYNQNAIQQSDSNNSVIGPYRISRKQNKNLEKIFRFYSQQHQATTNIQTTFDEIQKLHHRIIQGDFFKFCKDFDIPITKKDQMEVYRKISIKNNLKVNFDVF